MHTRAIAVALLAALVTAAPQAMARVDVPAKAVMTIASGRSTEFQDGIKWSNDTLSNAEKEAAVLKQIEDAHTMGVRVFFYLAPNNGTAHVGRLARWNAAARTFNAAHTGDKVCLSVMFTSDAVGDGSTTGVIPMFDTADAGGADSPLCQIASKPLVATRGNAVCINPLTGLSARGPQFAILTNTYNTATDHSDAACVTSLVNAGATVIKSFPWAIQKVAYSTSATIDTKKTAIEGTGTGVEFVMGVGSSWARACGIGGNGALTSNIEITDLNYWQHFLDGRQLAISKAVNYMLLNDAAPGALDEGSTITTSLICDSRDPVNHNVDSSGVNPGFTCPSVPSYLTAAIPAGYQNSLSVPFWTTRGLHRAQQVWSAWLRNSAEPDASLPFVGFMYRQHAWGLTGTWDICNAGSYSALEGGVGTTPQHMIALTSWAPDPTRVQVVLAGETIFDGTLPAKQMKQLGSTQQTLVSIGNRVGRPTIRVLNSSGTVIASREGLLEITNTPKHYNGQTGRNPHNYADYVDFAASGGAWSGIKIGSTGNVTNNVVNGVAGSGIVASQNADNVTISGNTVVSTKTAISVGSAQGSGLGDSMAVANNIIATATTGIMTAGDIGTDAVYPTNLIYQATTAMSTDVAAVATGTVTADPKFVSASDFHLQTSSPARDVGTLAYSTGADRVGRARGTTPDIGAYEFYDAAARSPCVSQDDAVLHDCAPGGTAYPCQAAKISCPAAPTLTSPQNISVGSAGQVITLGQNDDALITCSAVVTTRISVIGGDDVHIRGCEISQAWPSTEERGLSFVGTRKAYVEGVIVDMQDRCDALTIQPNRSDLGWTNTNTDLTIVNSWLGNNNVNTVGTCSGDCIEAQGSATRGGMAGSIDYTLRNVTCAAKGLGITIPDRYSSARSTASLDNVNMRFGVNGSPRSDIYRYADGGAPLLYLFGSSDADLQKWPVTLGANVFIDWKSSNRNISPGPATGTQAETDFSLDNTISFASTSQITGQVRRGPPSTYDFAPRAKLGANYDRTWFCN